MSHMYAPSARAMKRGVPPTARNARTAEFTPPTMTSQARANSEALSDIRGVRKEAGRSSEDTGARDRPLRASVRPPPAARRPAERLRAGPLRAAAAYRRVRVTRRRNRDGAVLEAGNLSV